MRLLSLSRSSMGREYWPRGPSGLWATIWAISLLLTTLSISSLLWNSTAPQPGKAHLFPDLRSNALRSGRDTLILSPSSLVPFLASIPPVSPGVALQLHLLTQRKYRVLEDFHIPGNCLC